MRVRGERECKDCGARWSYYDSGTVACPDCGSVHSVGLDEQRRLHTDSAATLDLAAAREAVADRPLREAAGVVSDAAADYVRGRGFVGGGDLLPLDGTFVAAAELRHVAGELERALDVTDAEERHLVALLDGADEGDRPDDVPESLRAARGLAAAEAVRTYRRDAAAYLAEHAVDDPAGRSALESLDDHARRIQAIDGDVPAATADRLVAAARAVGAYLRDGDDDRLAVARERLSRLE